MDAYHIKTYEPDPSDFIGIENIELNSLYVPDKNILVGYQPVEEH